MITAIEHRESKMYDAHLNCLNAIKPLLPPINEALEVLKAQEEEGNYSLLFVDSMMMMIKLLIEYLSPLSLVIISHCTCCFSQPPLPQLLSSLTRKKPKWVLSKRPSQELSSGLRESSTHP
jgi:hypothetical protein